MKTQHLILPAMLGMGLLASCSASDDAPDINGGAADGKAIRFAATTDFTRAGDITTNNLNTFYVYAYTGTGTTPETFMDDVKVTKSTGNAWTYSPLKYWPADESVDFYAYAPAGWVGTAGPLKPVAYDAYANEQDIIYAVSPNLTGVEGMANAQVLFNFRHALSKITVKLSSTNPTLKVQVSNVALDNIMTKGNFHFPGTSTSATASESNVGKWTDQNTPHPYILHMSQRLDEVLTLTSTPNDLSAAGQFGGDRYIMPQELVWLSNGTDKDTYLAVMCSVYDAQTDTKLWPNENTPEENIVHGSTFGDGLLKFRLSSSAFSEWKPGCHYIYNVVINSNEDMGAIEFGTPTVDTYIDVTTNYQ